MGVSANLIPTLIDGAVRYNFSGAVLMLGRQDVEISASELVSVFKTEGFYPKLSPKNWRESGSHILPECFFQALGFESVDSLDVSNTEGASIILDLNLSQTPHELIGRYDVIFDGGTLEHIFHLPNALARCADMLRAGGAFVHIGPMNNYVDHGFYQFSSTLWFDWFSTNGWTMLESALVRLPSSHRPEPSGWNFSFLPPDRLGTVGVFDDAPYMHFLIAKKEPNATSNRIPMQAYYAKKYADKLRIDQAVRSFSPYTVTDGSRSQTPI